MASGVARHLQRCRSDDRAGAPLGAREYRSRNVRGNSNASIRALSRGSRAAPVRDTARIMLCRSGAADPIRSPTCNGKRSARGGKGTDGSKRRALDSWRLPTLPGHNHVKLAAAALAADQPLPPFGNRHLGTVAFRLAPRDRPQLGGGNLGTRRSAGRRTLPSVAGRPGSDFNAAFWP
jgi:hypothetical protein